MDSPTFQQNYYAAGSCADCPSFVSPRRTSRPPRFAGLSPFSHRRSTKENSNREASTAAIVDTSFPSVRCQHNRSRLRHQQDPRPSLPPPFDIRCSYKIPRRAGCGWYFSTWAPGRRQGAPQRERHPAQTVP